MDAPCAKRPRAADQVRACASPQQLSVEDFQEHVKICQLQKFSFDYYVHGLVEESGEVLEAVRSKADSGSVGNELGDVSLILLNSISDLVMANGLRSFG
ncbi:unnamed protein product [Symbiodinium pilosum]|uniref:NTP pyrophosphohydrolase MazG-like domain-containing protein n=1 Tax=Symbiodinium pilosum TaxID=2952 RepID=A0A812WSE0_SYMPI|nr:unnamed protein product [Symbiodinium pilosum]